MESEQDKIETPVSKATAEVEETPQTTTSQVTVSQQETPVRVKNPKRVTAGKAGAAARKANQQKLLDELREKKAALKSDVTGVAEPRERLGEPTRDAYSHGIRSNGITHTEWTIWIVGGLGLAAGLWFLSERQNTAVLPRKVKTQNGGPPPASNDLKLSNPFCME